MTVINDYALLSMAPIRDMAREKYRDHGVSYGLSEAGYDIRVKQDVWFNFKNNEPNIALDSDPGKPGRFTIASTIEYFQMPLNLVGIVHDKSTWARQGLSVFNTVLEPGWNGFLTLELVFHGSEPLHIPAGAGIAQVIFHEIAIPKSYGDGKYQNQEDKPVPSRWVSDEPDEPNHMIGQHNE